MSWFGWGKKKPDKPPSGPQAQEGVQEESEKPRRRNRPQQQQQPQARRAAPAARPIPDNIKYAEQLKQIKERTGITDEQMLIGKLKIYGGDVNSVFMELDLEKSSSNTQSQSQSPEKKEQAATENIEAPAQTAAFSQNLRECISSQIREILIGVAPQDCTSAIEKMYSQSINGKRLYRLTHEEILGFGFPSPETFNQILLAAEKTGPPQVQAVTATDVEFKAAAIFNVGDTVSSQLGFGRVIDVRDDGIIVVALGGQTKGYFSPDALTLSPDHLDFSTGDIVRAPMGRCKVLRVRRGDNMIVVITPTGSEGYFHPSALEKIDSKFFLRDQLPNIRSWTAATVREAVAEIYPEVAERLYAASVGGEKLIGMTEDEVLHLSKMGNSFNAELWDRVAATLGLTSMKDVDALSQGIAKTGPVGPLSEQLASGPAAALGRQGQGDPALIKLGQQQSAQIGRLEDMMVELDRLTLTPQLFELRQRQARMVKKLSGLLSALPNGIQEVRAAEIDARKASFNAMDDEKVAGGGDAAAMAQLARRQDEVYARLVNAGNQLQEIAKKQGVKLPPFSPQPLPTFNSSMASMEKLIVEEKAQMATEEKSNFQLYQPNAVHGGKRGGDPLRAEVNGEAKSDDTFKVVFKVNKGEKREVDIPMSVGQKSVTVSGIKRAIEQFLGDARITEVRMGKKKTLQDTAELNIGRKRRIEGINVFTTDYEV